MPACLSKDLISSSYPPSLIEIGHDDQEPIPMRKQQQQQLGIVSILGPNDTSRINTTSFTYSQQPNNNSIRRTLSADMSSKKWLSNNGFSSTSSSPAMKRIGSSTEFQSLDGEKEMKPQGAGGGASFDAIWGSIQKKNNDGDHQKPPNQFDTWSSIINSNKEDGAPKSGIPLPPAYIHPSVKKSTGTLSEKSLNICTESLGSETGSDGFSSHSENSSEPEGDSDSDQQQQDQDIIKKEEELLPTFGVTSGEEIYVPKYNYYNNTASCKRAVTPKSFPPPLPSLADRDGTNLHMRSHRQNGRLVLEAVSVPSKNCLRAQRQDGRLLLSLTATATSEDQKEINDQQLDQFEEDKRTDQWCETKEKEEEEAKYVKDKDECNDVLVDKYSKGGSIIKMRGNNNCYSGNPDHHERFNKVTTTTTKPDHNEPIKEEPFVVQKRLASTLSQSLPPRPRALGRRIITNTASATAATLNLNTYEYYWRKNINKTPPVAAAATWPTTDACSTVPPPKEEIKEWPKNKFIHIAALNGKLASRIVDEKQQQYQQRESSSLMEVQKVRPFGPEGYLVPLLKQQGCKDPRRSLLFWEPHCIATI